MLALWLASKLCMLCPIHSVARGLNQQAARGGMHKCDGGMQQARLVLAISCALRTDAVPDTIPSGGDRAHTFLMVAWSRRI